MRSGRSLSAGCGVWGPSVIVGCGKAGFQFFRRSAVVFRNRLTRSVYSPGVIEAHDLTKTYRRGEREIPVLRGVSCVIPDGSFSVIVGPSGSGKSTLLYLLGALDEPTTGRVELDGRRLDKMDTAARDRLRRDELGFIFQSFNLLPNLTAVDNVVVPQLPQGLSDGDRDRAASLLTEVGLGDRLDHRPNQLSGGEQQRIAIVRALFRRPRYVLADEPTGELDSQRGAEIFDQLRSLQRETGATVVVVTHDERFLDASDVVFEMADGVLKD